MVIMICFKDGVINEVIDKDTGQSVLWEEVENNDYLEVE